MCAVPHPRAGAVRRGFRPRAVKAGAGSPTGERTGRGRVADLGAVLVAVLAVVLVFALTPGPAAYSFASAPPQVGLTMGIASWLALWWRRRAPVVLAGALLGVSLLVPTVAGAALVAVYTVGTLRPLRVVVAVVGAALLVTATSYLLHPPASGTWPADVAPVVIAGAFYVASGAWGATVRARRELLASLADRARRAESEQELLLDRARRRERERIAREMHDVLAHRLSLLSVHAGALEFRPDAPADIVAATAGIIRASAHQSLTDLRELLTVLREPASPAPGADTPDGDPTSVRPAPGLDRIHELVDEACRAGNATLLHMTVTEPARVRGLDQRTIYRVVQEGLTNARKHAAHQPVDVTIGDADDGGVSVDVVNPLPPPATATSNRIVSTGPVPGSAVGLIGLDERVALAGGTSSHGATPDGHFTLRAHLPAPR